MWTKLEEEEEVVVVVVKSNSLKSISILSKKMIIHLPIYLTIFFRVRHNTTTQNTIFPNKHLLQISIKSQWV